MNLRSLRLMIFVLVMVLATLACSLFGGSQEDNGDEVAAPTEEVLPAEQGALTRSENGGFTFVAVPGWVVEEEMGMAAVSSPTADEDVGPMFMLNGGKNSYGFTSDDELLQDFMQYAADVEFSNQRQTTIAGIPGLAVDLKGMYEGKEVEGRIAVVLVSTDQYFQIIGIAPSDQWEQVGPTFDELIKTLSFFEPADLFEEDLLEVTEPTETPVPTEPPSTVEETPESEGEVEQAPPREEIRQWAVQAIASSEYSNPDWAAIQATGAPDTLDCGDYATAWASLENDTVEWLELTYDLPVTPLEVNIYQSHTPDQVVKVELIDTLGIYHEVYTGVPEMTDCPYVLSIPIANAEYQAVGVKITVDQSQLGLPWAEIDAAELVGLAGAGEAKTPVQPTEVIEDTSGEVSDIGDLASWSWTTYLDPQAPADNEVKAVAVSEDGSVWIGGNKSGVTRLQDGTFNSYTTADGLGADYVYDLAVAPDGTIWAGTGFGLAQFDGSVWTNYTKGDGLIHDNVYSVAVSTDGTVWAGTTAGVSSFDGSTWTSYDREDGLVDTFVFDIAIDEADNLWFATVGGVSFFDGSTWKSYSVEDGLSFDIVNTAAVAQDGSVWFGTSSGGVSRFDGNTWTTYTEDADYDLYYVKAITVDQDGALWFATEGHGVYRYDGENWLNFTKADGLPHDWVDAGTLAPDGSLWFGFRKGGVAQFGP